MIKKELKIILQFLFTVFVTIAVTVAGGNTVAIVWYYILLILYTRSKNEPFWLAFFLVTTDGFMGFLGVYSTLLPIVPGLPGIELAQLYIFIAIYKIWKQKIKMRSFYRGWGSLLFIYVILLLAVGIANGLSGDLNVYFKVGKMIFPLALFYTTPRLINSIDKYASLFNILFIVFLFGFAAQLFTVFTGFSPAASYKVEEQHEMEVGKNLRSFYNPFITLVVLCGSLFFAAIKEQKYFTKVYLNLIAILCFGMAFLSATRGWIIGFAFTIIMYNIIVQKLALKNFFFIAIIFMVVFAVSLSFEKINRQIMFSLERTLTLESLAKGDKSADGTLVRLDERAPKVMNAWADNPILGWGFSNTFFDKLDVHVGNQTVLMHSGVIGITLLYSFLIFVCNKLIKHSKDIKVTHPYKRAGLVIPIFIIGWFFIHSTSSLQFAFYGIPLYIMPQAIVLSMANFVVNYKV